MNDEQFQQQQAWLAALHEDNKKLRAQIKQLTEVIEAIGAHAVPVRRDVEQTRFRIGALCRCFIVIPLVCFLAFCSMATGAAAGKMVNDAPATKRAR